MLCTPTRRLLFMLRSIRRRRFVLRRSLRLLLFSIFICTLVLFYFGYRVSNDSDQQLRHYPARIMPPYICPCISNDSILFDDEVWTEPSRSTDDRVLVLVETLYSPLGRDICDTLNALKLDYKIETLGKNLPLLTTQTRGRFALIIVENYYKYVNLAAWNRQLLDKYCIDYGVGLIGFLGSKLTTNYVHAKVKGSTLALVQKQRVRNLQISTDSTVAFIGRAGGPTLAVPYPDTADWVLFRAANRSNFEPVLVADAADEQQLSIVVFDKGTEDGVQRILFGQKLSGCWLVRLTFVDAVRKLTNGRLGMSRDRYVQVDIDDIFVGQVGRRMIADDVLALLRSQKLMQSWIPGFTYNLGFSGRFFRNGDELEDRGDELLVENSAKFEWFPHMWRHNHAHKHNLSYLEAVMTQNRLFAESMKITVSHNYSVAPHHGGVYPVHEPLYDAWKSVWHIRVTATEEYPHLKPASCRRGFIYKDIMVLPRQTCSLYTHTHFFDSYPGGVDELRRNIEGGNLFFSIVYNPFALFMTHQQNYANDRLAVYTFENVVRFIRCWTNLRLKWLNPAQMGIAYFERYSRERAPIWGNPCIDPRHVDILSSELNCSQLVLPNAVVVGSTALYTFLKLHPDVRSNEPISGTFEELQFFGGANYNDGLGWYLQQFGDIELNENGTTSTTLVFEKSATYFDSYDAPMQMNALIPNAKLIVILLNPGQRAYSWFQHMRAHNDSTAIKYTFDEVLAATADGADGANRLWKLRQRCIGPGRYAHHLDRWLEYYPASRILLVDGDLLRENPAQVMTTVLQFLALSPLDYTTLLKYNQRKGFYCTAGDNSTKIKCLGKSKGRKYSALSDEHKTALAQIYLQDNIALHKMIVKMAWTSPVWLKQQLVA